MSPWIVWSGVALTACTMVYSVFAWLAVLTRIRPPGRRLAKMPAVTIFKPLCGASSSIVTFGVPVAAFGSSARQLLALPFRDVLSVALWSWSFATRRVRWRNDHYQVNRDGSVLPVVRA